MKTQLKTALTAISVMAAAATLAHAGTITFSGYNWTTSDANGNESSGINLQNTYTTPDANTGVIGGRYHADSTMYVSLALGAGDTVSYDYYLSNNDPGYAPGANGGTYYGDWTGIFNTSTSDFASAKWASARVISGDNSHTSLTLDDQAGNNNTFSVTSGLATGVHFAFTFDVSSYSVTATSIANSADTLTYTGSYLNGFTVSDIQSFRAGLWDSEQTATLANFTVTSVPEPATMALIGLGCTGLFLMRRRQA